MRLRGDFRRIVAGRRMKSGRLFVWLQYVLPQHALSRLVLRATRVRTPWFKNVLIRGFLKLYAVDMSEAVQADPFRYGSFNEFFTRALKPDVRAIAMRRPRSIACPVDGMISEAATSMAIALLQAKGRRYTPRRTAGRREPGRGISRAARFATIYLAPFNYHRVHMPLRGRLLETVYVPGRLFSVNAVTAARAAAVCAQRTRADPVRHGIRRICADPGRSTECRQHRHRLGRRHHARAAARGRPRCRRRRPLEQGRELGRFNMGSTVICCSKQDRARWHADLRAGATVRLGQSLGTLQ